MIGLDTWFLNFISYPSLSSVTSQSLADIRSPYQEYGIYCMFKTAEVTSLVAGCVLHPLYRLYLLRRLTPETTTNNSTKVIRNICRRIQGRFLVASLVASPLVTAAAIYFNGYSREDVAARCYAIRNDKHGLVHDRSAMAMGLIGWYWKRFQGAVDGINLAIPYFLFYTQVLEKYTNPMLVDIVPEAMRYENVEAFEDEESELIRFAHHRSKPQQQQLARRGREEGETQPGEVVLTTV